MEAFQAQKWSASETPPAPARASSRGVMRFQSRHSPVPTRKTATMRSEKPRRQTAIATGSAVESRTSGPAKEMPSSESASTQYGFVDMAKKKPVREAPALFFRTTLLALRGFDQSHLRGGTARVSQNLIVVLG